MKPFLLALLLSVSASCGYSQRNTIVGVFAGGGLASKNNFDVALSGGVDIAKGIGLRSLLGVEILYQQYSLLYDNEANAAQHGTGHSGEILRHSSAYAFISPKFRYCTGKHQNNHIYIAPGIGFKTGGYDSVHSWNSQYTPGGYIRYDTTIDLSKNINGMVLRVGVGAVQYLWMGPHWRFTFNEDFGFLPGSLTKTGGYSDETRSSYSPSKLNPAYISIRIGISHTRLP